MPTSKEVKEAIGKPQLMRLKALGDRVRIGTVMGNRILIKVIKPWTDMDRLEKAGTLVIPETVKERNQPLPSTGMVVEIGREVSDEDAQLLTGAAVMFSKFAGHDFIVMEEDFKLLAVEEVLCTLEYVEPVVPVKE
jgi:co-chaperonin GroES (HSP10)